MTRKIEIEILQINTRSGYGYIRYKIIFLQLFLFYAFAHNAKIYQSFLFSTKKKTKETSIGKETDSAFHKQKK